MAAAARGVEHSVAPGTKNWFRCARRLGAVWRPSATQAGAQLALERTGGSRGTAAGAAAGRLLGAGALGIAAALVGRPVTRARAGIQDSLSPDPAHSYATTWSLSRFLVFLVRPPRRQ